MEVNKQYVLIGGFAGSGSSALFDLLKEVESCYTLESELRFIVDPDGVMSLENALVNDWTPYSADKAIKRYKSLIYALNKKYRSPYCGLDHSKIFGKSLVETSEEYIKELTADRFRGVWFGIHNLSFRIAFKLHLMFKLNINKFYKDIFLSYPQSDFYGITKKYLNKLFYPLTSNVEKNIILDEPFASLNPSKVLNYFDSAKIICINRDPRDIFVNAKKYDYKFIPQEADKFVLWYKFMMDRVEKNSKNHCDDILNLSFEDLVLSYEDSKKKIFKFLDINEKDHAQKNTFLDPNVSKRNIGVWKTFNNPEAVELIQSELAQYCVEL